MRFIFLVAIGLFMTMPFAAKAESGFGTGFTEQSARAFEDPAEQTPDDNMAAAAEEAQNIEPAAGETKEQGEESESMNTENTDHQQNDHIFEGEIITDGTFLELTD